MVFKKEQYEKVMERYRSGDVKARDFILAYPSMTDEEANAYLSSLDSLPSDSEGQKKQMSAMIEFLSKDELEAIDGYDKAIKLCDSLTLIDEIAVFGDKLKEIKAEEERHLKELGELQERLLGKEGK